MPTPPSPSPAHILSSLGMVEIVPLGRGQEGQVVAAVVDGRANDDERDPQPGHGDMGPAHKWATDDGRQVDDVMLQGVAINGTDADWGGPLVVDLVHVLVEKRMVEEPAMRRYIGREGERKGEREGREGRKGGRGGREGREEGRESGWEEDSSYLLL